MNKIFFISDVHLTDYQFKKKIIQQEQFRAIYNTFILNDFLKSGVSRVTRWWRWLHVFYIQLSTDF